MAAAGTNTEFMRDIQESGDGRTAGALSRPHPAQTRPGRPLPLIGPGPAMGTVCLADGPRVSLRCAGGPGRYASPQLR